MADNVTQRITENRDALGLSTGYTDNVNYETIPRYNVASLLLKQTKGGMSPITELIVGGHGNQRNNCVS